MQEIKSLHALPDPHGRSVPPDDRNSDPTFVSYYEQRSISEGAEARFRIERDKMLRLRRDFDRAVDTLNLLVVGCGPGTECQIWAELGISVVGIDISEPFIELARKRAGERGFEIKFDVGDAVALPYPSNSFDVCL